GTIIGGEYRDNDRGLLLGNNTTISDCLVTQNAQAGITVNYDSGSTEIDIRNSQVVYNMRLGVERIFGSSSVSLTDSVVCSNGLLNFGPGLEVIDEGGNTIQANCLGNPWTVTVAQDGSGDYADVGAALLAAYAGDTISIGPGTYVSTEPLLVMRPITITGDPAGGTVLTNADGQGTVLSIAIDPLFFEPIMVVSNLVLENASRGLAFDRGYSSVGGGFLQVLACAIRGHDDSGLWLNMNADWSVLVDACLIEDNAAYNGAGLYLSPNDAYIQITNTTVQDNSAFNEGGGLYVTNGTDDVYVGSGTILRNNDAEQGGGIAAADSVTRVAVGGALIEGNSASYGGGIKGSAVLDQASLADNIANFGGAICLLDFEEAQVDNSFIVDNIASYGGGIYNSRSNLDVTNSVLGNNSAWQGGGLFHFETVSSITDSVISGNTAGDTAAEGGGGVHGLVALLTVADSDFCGNTPLDLVGAWTGEGNTFEPDCLDCNGNGLPDTIDLQEGTSLDCNGNAIPDECDLVDGTSLDCNGNSIPDSCDIANGLEADCQGNGLIDWCEIADGTAQDCNGNNIPDSCDIADGTEEDCQPNGVPDSCDIDSGDSNDNDADQVPDECQCLEDVNNDGLVDVNDILLVIAEFGQTDGDLAGDVNLDGVIDVNDLLLVISAFGGCPV
ncbi:MAG: dockerin type I domain-containing protein, partial [Phycisphaerales bacterium]|nr:dockerin type I domain-containing protein [Phycisphaerales bacterium]